jgi:hypothetical protein
MSIFDTIGDMLGLNKGKATTDAANQNKQLLGTMGSQIGGLIDTGTNKQAGYLNDSLDLASLGPNAKGILGDAYGLNGPDGAARATAAFQTGPGYSFLRDQGDQAVMRNRSALGGLQSGGTEMDLMKFGTGLADQTYQQWLGNLNTGIDRQMGAQGNLADLYGQDTGKRIGLASDIGSGTMAANNQAAAGREAGQGSLLDLFSNVAGIAGSFAGMGGFGKPTTGGPGVGAGATGANTYGGGRAGYYGYGGGF